MQNMFALTLTWIWIPFPNGYCTHLGMDLCPKDRSSSLLHTFQSGDQSQSEPMEKACIVQEYVSESESESGSGNGNKPFEHIEIVEDQGFLIGWYRALQGVPTPYILIFAKPL